MFVLHKSGSTPGHVDAFFVELIDINLIPLTWVVASAVERNAWQRFRPISPSSSLHFKAECEMQQKNDIYTILIKIITMTERAHWWMVTGQARPEIQSYRSNRERGSSVFFSWANDRSWFSMWISKANRSARTNWHLTKKDMIDVDKRACKKEIKRRGMSFD